MTDELYPVDDAGVPVSDSRYEEIIRSLPFVSETGGRAVFWKTETVGLQDVDIERGERYAALALAASRQTGSHLILTFILRDMMLGGSFGAVEAGFLATVASAARAGVLN